MSIPIHLQFDAPDASDRLPGLSDIELDALGFGVVEMNRAGLVMRYNETESRYSGLPRERVLGRHFFRDVAPCSNNRHVAQRFDEPMLDETLEYSFALRMKPVPVTLRLLKPAGDGPMHLLVQWT